MTAMSKVPTTRESLMILNDKLNDSLADCFRCRKNRRKTRKWKKSPPSSRWSILNSRENFFLIILLVWLNLLSSIECQQKPHQGINLKKN